VLRALQLPLLQGESRIYNLAGADSPRWNEVLIDLALAIGATPVRRVHPAMLRLHAWTDPLLAVALQRATKGRNVRRAPDARAARAVAQPAAPGSARGDGRT
jgi:hypothetical protein